MTIIKPFKAIRPRNEIVQEVALLSLDYYNTVEDLESYPMRPKPKKRLLSINSRYHKLIDQRFFYKEKRESLYLYMQSNHHDSYLGIIGCASIDDYVHGVIKIHEETFIDREEKLVQHIESCDFNAEPICVCYPDNEVINSITLKITRTKPIYHFVTPDNILHTFWNINNDRDLEIITSEFKKTSKVYIADGHHRSASNASICDRRRRNNPFHAGSENYNYFLCVFYPESQLKIYDFNRVVKDLNNIIPDVFLNKLKDKFEVKPIKEHFHGPTHLHEFGMYLNGSWYLLNAKDNIYDDKSLIGSLDASILTEQILSPLLDINDLRTDKRIDFVPGIKGLQELENTVNSGLMEVAFALYPASLDQLKQIADAGYVMPPKTTWIEPKQLSGLIIQSLS